MYVRMLLGIHSLLLYTTSFLLLSLPVPCCFAVCLLAEAQLPSVIRYLVGCKYLELPGQWESWLFCGHACYRVIPLSGLSVLLSVWAWLGIELAAL